MAIRTVEEARAWRAKLSGVTNALEDSAALAHQELYPAWQSGQAVAVGYRARHGGQLYRCIQAHTTQGDWPPDATPALWARVSVEAWPEWVQPTGAHDAYAKGDKVTYGGSRYISLIDGNTWSPDGYPAGWEVQ